MKRVPPLVSVTFHVFKTGGTGPYAGCVTLRVQEFIKPPRGDAKAWLVETYSIHRPGGAGDAVIISALMAGVGTGKLLETFGADFSAVNDSPKKK